MEVEQSRHSLSEQLSPRESPAKDVFEEETPIPSLKRQRSESIDSTGKRRRTSQSSHDESRRPSLDGPVHNRPPPRRPSGAVVGAIEERKRGARLFGGILGVLSKNKTAKVNQKRAEVEKKQQEKLKTHAVQYSDDRNRKYSRGGYDNSEQSMRQRHSRLLKMAGSLQTRATPKISYKPWKLLPEQERRIKNQIADAEETIDQEKRERESDEVRRRQDQRSPSREERKSEERGPQESDTREDVKMEDDEECDRNTSKTSTNDLPTGEEKVVGLTKNDKTLQVAEADDIGEGGEVVMDAGEDTVIY